MHGQQNIKYEVHLGLYVKCPIFLSDFNQIWSFATDFREVPNKEFS